MVPKGTISRHRHRANIATTGSSTSLIEPRPAASTTAGPLPSRDGSQTIFISGVSSEFGILRDKIAGDLLHKGHIVHNQSGFDVEDASVIEKLERKIVASNAVIFLIGSRCGSFPPIKAETKYKQLRPRGIKQASYTQWEYLLAEKHGVPIYRFSATSKYRRDRAADEP